MKVLFSLALLVLLALPSTVSAQPRDWIKVAPTDERFQALMPLPPTTETAEHNYVSANVSRTAIGKVYSTSVEGSTFTIWSLETSRVPSNRVDEIGAFLDDYADLVWDSLLKPLREPLPPTAAARMSYKSELSMGVIPGRGYSLTIGREVGATRFYLDGARLYVLVALTSRGNYAAIQDFFSGFLAKSATDNPFPQPPVTLEAESYHQVYRPKETTTRAKVLYKTEPTYTEAARRYSVTGTVVLHGFISTDGRIVGIHVDKRLPHGLTEASIAATQRVRFTPATKDGLSVVQWIQLEYNFNLY